MFGGCMFLPYHQNLNFLFPRALSEFVPPDSKSRIISPCLRINVEFAILSCTSFRVVITEAETHRLKPVS